MSLTKQMVIERAKWIWEQANRTKDFCVQLDYFDDDCTMIFGSVNRVRWSLDDGFRIDRSYCTEHFISAFEKALGR